MSEDIENSRVNLGLADVAVEHGVLASCHSRLALKLTKKHF